jgi:hypothetical protein
MAGRHRKRRVGLPPIASGAGIVAVLVCTVLVARPADITYTLPPPTQALHPPPPPTTTTTPPPPQTTLAQPATPTSPLSVPTFPPIVHRTTPPAPSPPPPPEPPAVVEPAPPAAAPSNPVCENLGVQPHVKRACDQITAAVPGVKVIGGRALRPRNPRSCHPLGLALDFMVYDNRALGDRLVAYVRAHKDELGVTTILWRVTAHWNHPHVSFAPCYR